MEPEDLVIDAGGATGAPEVETPPVETLDLGTTPDGSPINPAWKDFLDVLPSSLHPTVYPVLRKWDSGVQERFQKVQSQYEPYKSVLETGLPAEQITASLQLAQMIASNPRDFYDKMGQRYAEEWGLNKPGDQGQNNDEYSLEEFDGEEGEKPNPLLEQLKKQQELLANVVANDFQARQAREEAEVQRAADDEVEQEIASIKETYGEAVKPAVLKTILSVAVQNGMPLPEAAEFVFKELGVGGPARPTPPSIVTPGGGVPLQNIDPAGMNGKDTRSFVAQVLAQAAQANQS
jgi:hypothetical protein